MPESNAAYTISHSAAVASTLDFPNLAAALCFLLRVVSVAWRVT
jgi:hypothetical protein